MQAKNKPKIFTKLEEISETIPAPILWMDINGIILGTNDAVFQSIGMQSKKELPYKTCYDFYPKEIADVIMKNIQQIVKEKRAMTFEESIKDCSTGKIRWFLTTRKPLVSDFDKDVVVGVVENGMEITSEKENEILKLENTQQKERLKIADIVSHDIRSPARTICTMVENSAEKLPEEIRVPLREMATRIVDVANGMISRYEVNNETGLEEQQTVIASLSLMQILSEKKIQTLDPSISFTSDYSRESIFACIKVQSSNFKRMISNLLNNAVESLEGRKGTIHLGLTLDDTKKDIKIIIQDNGKGMSEETANKIKNGDTVGTDKKDGHGIGLTQIRETITRNRGKLDIVSKLGEGTKIILTFPMTITPQWLTKEIKLNKGDIVIVLDDDMAIHATLDFDFKEHTESIKLRHFMLGSEAISYINSSNEKNKMFLLTDYELIKQKITGIDVIKQTNLYERSILVTSHYADVKLQKQTMEIGVKILPKDLALDASIKICEDDANCVVVDKVGKIDVVIAEDDDMMASTLSDYLESNDKKVDLYRNPEALLNNVFKYTKDTLILIDNTYEGSKLTGIDVAKQLHEMGYTKLYLFSGTEFGKDELPEYLKAILKTDIDGLMDIINGSPSRRR